MISIMTDITEQLKREEILKHEAEYDSLTGLNNRKNAVSLMEKEFNRKAGGEGWEDKLACMIMKASPESYLSVDMDIKGEDELSFSTASQAGMLSRRFYKRYGVEFNSLEILKSVYLVYIENHVFVSEITDEQMKLLKKISVSLEYK